MSEVTRLLDAASAGDPRAAAELLPLVYDELRKLATARMAGETPGQTLQATALVHEAYLRLVGAEQSWNGRAHFLAAAAEAMRRILVDRARHKKSLRCGGGLERVELREDAASVPEPSDEILAVDEALTRLAAANPKAAELVKLRYFAGLSVDETAQALDMSPRAVDRLWSYARAWLQRAVGA
jgi:RNA polymerase sigma factor (TIGR02999 family)